MLMQRGGRKYDALLVCTVSSHHHEGQCFVKFGTDFQQLHAPFIRAFKYLIFLEVVGCSLIIFDQILLM